MKNNYVPYVKSFLLLLGNLFFTGIQYSHAQNCTGTPSGGTAAISVTSPLPFIGNTTLTVTGYSTGTGITGHWEISFGQASWIAINVANIDTLNPPIGWCPAYYRFVNECANSGLSGYSNVIMVGSPDYCQDTVWPGDANWDHLANNMDILPIAVAYGTFGPQRNDTSISWTGHYSIPEWSGGYAGPGAHAGYSNLKHVDCNGDGVINAADTLAISQNYGLTHNRPSGQPAARVTSNPNLYFDISGINLTPGAAITVPIKLGTTALPVNNIYAIAGTLITSGVVSTTPPVLNFTNSWLGNTSNLLRFSKGISNSDVDWTIGRMDHRNTSGSGTIGTVSFTVPTNISIGQQMVLQMQNVKIIDSNGKEFTGFNVLSDTLVFSNLSVSQVPTNTATIEVYPNPASKFISVAYSKEGLFQITDVVGRIIQTVQLPANSNKQEIQLPALSAGMYYYKYLVSDKMLLSGKLVIQ